MCVLFAALFQLEPSPFAFRTFFPPKENHNVGLLRFDDDHDPICYRFAQVQIFGGKSNVFKSLQDGFNYLNLRSFNQDPLENLFSSICQHGAANTNPTSLPTAALKTVVVNSLASPKGVDRN
jgi:hypothetical protein